MPGVFAMLVFAAFVEAFWSSIGWMPAAIKYAVAGHVGDHAELLALGGEAKFAEPPRNSPSFRCSAALRRARRVKLETLTVELRPRSSWEAMELGAALVRRHAAAIWTPWLLVTGAVFVLLNLAAWAVGQIWLAWVLMWWLRPVFDRIPQYVLSRAVFGSVPGTAETLRAQLRWGWRPMLGHSPGAGSVRCARRCCRSICWKARTPRGWPNGGG